MIEIVMLMMLGNSQALIDFQLEVDDLTLEIEELELQFAEIQEIKLAKEIKMNGLFNEYKQFDIEKDWEDNTKTRQEFVEFQAKELKNAWRVEFYDLKDISKEYDKLEDKLDSKKTLLVLVQKDLDNLIKASEANSKRFTNVSISLSKTCQIMIEAGLDTNCPTYRELFDLYDNTDPMVSGVMIDYGYDIERFNIMNKHWKHYETTPDYDLIMVDPDAVFQSKSVNIEIQSNSFPTLSQVGSQKQNSFKDGSYTIWKDFKVTDDCHNILVAPDMKLIAQAVEFAVNQCSGEVDVPKTVTYVKPTDFNRNTDWQTSPALVYQNWLKDAIKNNKELRLGLD